METDRVAVALRPRGSFEAVDLGFRMARAWWRPLFGQWLAIVVPVAAGLVIALREHPLLALGLLWWLRPAFDRVPLHVLSRALFGDTPRLGDTLRALPRLLCSGIPTSLLMLRFAPTRSFLLPVLQLEGLRGAARRERSGVLGRQDAGTAAGLHFVGALFHGVLLLGAWVGIGMMVPDEIAWDVGELLEPSAADAADDPGQILVPLVYLVGISIVEPLLVAGGFALYLNRRIHLEGWDLDLAFRSLARRADAARAPLRRAAALALLLGFGLASPLRAEPLSGCDPEAPEAAAACVESVLASPDFGRVESQWRWQLRSLETDRGLDLASHEWIADLVAISILVLFALAIGAVLVTIALRRRRDAHTFAPTVAPPEPPTLLGLELDPGGLPDDVVSAAREAWRAGRRAAALSLLYRGAIVRLIEAGTLEVPRSATEGDCVRLVRGAGDEGRTLAFEALTKAWVAARYAGEPPDTAHFETLCERFVPAFGTAAS